MVHELARNSAQVAVIYYCPHHPDDDCECRKPKTDLFLQVAQELDINLSHSFVLGDMQMDVDAGKALGCKTALVATNPQGESILLTLPTTLPIAFLRQSNG